jgi:hypothetical protein
MTKWTWRMRFFAIFFASALTLLLMGATWLAGEAYNISALVGTTIVLGEICVGSFILWMITDARDSY